MLASRFRLKKSPSNKNLPNTLLKTRFPFLYVSTGLDTKTWTITSNRNFESSMSIRCLAPQHLFRFFHLCRGFFLCLWQLCSLFCPPPQLSTERWGKKKKSVCNGLLFPRNLDPSLIPGDPVILLVCGFRRRDNLLAWHELFANLYELTSWFWEEYNHFEQIWKVYGFDKFSSNFAKTS